MFSGKELLQNVDDWTPPEPPPEPIQKKRGIIFLDPEDMQEAKRSMKDKCIKTEDVKNLPPIEEIHGLDTPTHVVEVNYIRTFNESDVPYTKTLVNAWTNLITTLLRKNTSIIMPRIN